LTSLAISIAVSIHPSTIGANWDAMIVSPWAGHGATAPSPHHCERGVRFPEHPGRRAQRLPRRSQC
jgi:hypothetical protein